MIIKMSWLNLNDSLNNLKGQITNFATDLLSEGAPGTSESPDEQPNTNQKITELQNLVASQEAEINSLRRQNEELYSKLQSSKQQTPANIVGESSQHAFSRSSDDWFWDPPDNSTQSSTSSHLVPSSSERNSPGESELVDKLNKRVNELQTEIDNLTSEKYQFETDVKKFGDDVSYLEQQNKKLAAENQDLVASLNQLDQDCQQTTEKLVSLRDTLQLEFNQLKSDYDSLSEKHLEFVEKDSKLNSVTVEYKALKSAYGSLLEEKKRVDEENQQLLEEITTAQNNKCTEESVSKLQEDFNILSCKYKKQVDDNEKLRYNLSQDSNQNSEIIDLRKNLEGYQIKIKEAMTEKCILVNVIYNIFGIFKDLGFDRIEIDTFINDEAKCDKLLNRLNNCIKELYDFKWKTQTLEKKICEISHEKTLAVQEKNKEIEKLLKNSEVLSQEVIIKTENLRHFENECLELSEKNEMLLNELQLYKNDSGLQTISETNEDNVLLLESQIDIANKRISELEQMLKETRSTKSSNGEDSAEEFTMLEEPNTEAHRLNAKLVDIKLELDSTKQKLSDLQKCYEDLQVKYNEAENKSKEVDALNAIIVESKKILEAEKIRNLEIEEKMKKISDENTRHLKKLEFLYSESNRLNIYITELKLSINQKEIKITELGHEIETSRTELQNVKEESILLKSNSENIDYPKLKQEIENLQSENNRKTEKIMKQEQVIHDMKTELEVIKKDSDLKKTELNQTSERFSSESKIFENHIAQFKFQVDNLGSVNKTLEEKCKKLENDLEKLNSEKNELNNIVLMKHNENICYHAEIQRLNELLHEKSKEFLKLQEEHTANSESITKEEFETIKVNLTRQLSDKSIEADNLKEKNNFLEEKCDILTKNLLEEQSKLHKFTIDHQNCAENIASLSKELERLRQHLLETEETYTQELLVSEQKMKEMQTNMLEMQQRERDSSSVYTSASIRASQQVETLQNQLRLVTQQRDEYQSKLSNIEDCQLKQSAALTNLQCVLEQFQRDKERDIEYATEKIRVQINMERSKQAELQSEIDSLKSQLAETREGLKAASRLQEQLEKTRQQSSNLKEEVMKLQEHLDKSESRCKELSKQNDLKVDKTLLKNLVVGYVASNPNRNKDQEQVLKLLGTVLDFSRDDNEKINKNQVSGSWISSLLHPQARQQMSQQSLSEAFIRFLESESQPKQIPTLLQPTMERRTSTDSTASSSASHRQTSLLGEVVLPTFVEFAQNRSSSSILKDVLKDNK